MDLQTGKKKRYTLVSPELADMAKRLLSVTAPLAIALLGHKQGDVVDAKVPGGVRRLDITRVRHPPKRAEDRNALLRKYRISQPNRNLTSAPVT
jgi:regulator of nucleoside diphosphate kinase